MDVDLGPSLDLSVATERRVCIPGATLVLFSVSKSAQSIFVSKLPVVRGSIDWFLL